MRVEVAGRDEFFVCDESPIHAFGNPLQAASPYGLAFQSTGAASALARAIAESGSRLIDRQPEREHATA
jgi:hypothetical protein